MKAQCPDETIEKIPEALKYFRDLKKMRLKKGISQDQLAKKIGVTRNIITNYEKWKTLPKIKNYNKLADFFGWKKIKLAQSIRKTEIFSENASKQHQEDTEAELKRIIEQRQKALTFTFEVGKCYSIWSTKNGFKNSKGNNPLTGTTWDEDCIFRYEGKQGIHHCFREIRGDWTRTYTDCQLIGKYIKEVNNE